MTPLFCDLHCHLLPGLDDGPETMEATLELARAQVRGGIGRVVCTTHSSPRMPVAAAAMREALDAVRVALAEQHVPLVVESGAEVAMTRLPDLDAGELRELALAGGRWILLEAPLTEPFPVEEAFADVVREGLGVVLAHPERCRVFQEDPARLRTLVEQGARVSVTASALTGAFGRVPREAAAAMVAAGLVHNVASDAHDAVRRAPDLLARLQGAGLAERAQEWCADFPAEALGAPASAPDEAPPPVALAAEMAAEGTSAGDIAAALTQSVPPAAARRLARRAVERARAGLQSPVDRGDT